MREYIPLIRSIWGNKWFLSPWQYSELTNSPYAYQEEQEEYIFSYPDLLTASSHTEGKEE